MSKTLDGQLIALIFSLTKMKRNKRKYAKWYNTI